MLDLYKLRIFNAVVAAGSFSAAAEQLYITQSAVSQHIKELETSLGQTLFERSRRGVKLTTEGELLANYSRQIFDLVAQAELALVNVARLTSGKVSLGATPGVGVYLVPEWVQRFRGRYPQLTVALQTGITTQIVEDVLGRRLDIGIIEGELEGIATAKLTTQVIAEVEQQVVVGFRHPLWDAASVRLENLNQQSFIMRQPNSQSRIWLEAALRAQGITPHIGAEFDNLESIKQAVISGMCLAILPLYVVQREVDQHLLRIIPFEDVKLTRTLKLIWHAQVPLSPIAQVFLKELQPLP